MPILENRSMRKIYVPDLEKIQTEETIIKQMMEKIFPELQKIWVC